MNAGSEVTIEGRAFRLGAVYAPRRRGPGRGFKPRRLLSYTADSSLPGGRVRAVTVPSGSERTITGEDWAAWAGEEVAG